MKIKNISIKNFKCLGPDEIKIDFSEDIIVLIGENNVGKSAILKALNYFFSNIRTIPPDDFLNKQCDLDHAIEISVTFHDLSDGDKAHRAVTSYITTDGDNQLWILKKKYYYVDGEAASDIIAIVNGVERPNPAGLSQNPADLFTNEKMQKINIEAVKDISEIAEGGAKTAFSQVFNLILKDDLIDSTPYKNLVSALEQYSELFQGTTQLSKIKEVEELINKKLRRMVMAKSKINAEPPKAEKLLPVPMLLTNDNRDIDVLPSEQGHGLQRTIIFALLEILAETTSPIDKTVGPRNLFLIEEPEIYMHPQMERKISDTLYEIALSGQAQVICTTHSPIFINLADKHKALVRVIRESDNSVKIIQKGDIFTGEDREEKRNKLRMITNFDPGVNEVFFAKRTVLVEGDTEVAIFREAAELLNYFESEDNKHKKRDTTFINCRGKWTIPLIQEVLNHFDIKYVVIHDKDDEELDENANGKILNLLDNKEAKRMYFDKKIETALGITDTGKEKPIKALEQVHKLEVEGQLENKIGNYVKFAYGIT